MAAETRSAKGSTTTARFENEPSAIHQEQVQLGLRLVNGQTAQRGTRSNELCLNSIEDESTRGNERLTNEINKLKVVETLLCELCDDATRRARIAAGGSEKGCPSHAQI